MSGTPAMVSETLVEGHLLMAMDQEKLKAEKRARNERLLNAYIATEPTHDLGGLVLPKLAGALDELAAIWREDADTTQREGKRGHDGKAKALRIMAGNVVAIAQDLRTYGVGEHLSQEPAVAITLSETGKEQLALGAAREQAEEGGPSIGGVPVSAATVAQIAQAASQMPPGASLADVVTAAEQTLEEAAKSIIETVTTEREGAKGMDWDKVKERISNAKKEAQESVTTIGFSGPVPGLDVPASGAVVRCNHTGVWHNQAPDCPSEAQTVTVSDAGALVESTIPHDWNGSALTRGREHELAEPATPIAPFATLASNPFIALSSSKARTGDDHLPTDLPVFQLTDPESSWHQAPGHTSPSQASLAASCAMAWWLKYRRGAPERPSWASVGGKALHQVIEWIERGRFGNPDLLTPGAEGLAAKVAQWWDNAFKAAIEKEALESVFPMQSWRASNAGREDENWWSSEGPEMVHKFLAWRVKWRAAGWEQAYGTDGLQIIEKEMKVNGVKVVIDSAWYHAQRKELAIIDWKSGSFADADHFQHATYQAVLGAGGELIPYAINRVLGASWRARKGELGPAVDVVKRHSSAELALRLNAPRVIDNARAYIPNTNGGYGGCNSCSLKLSCPVGSVSSSEEVQLLTT